MTPNLTLTYGVRYMNLGVPYETQRPAGGADLPAAGVLRRSASPAWRPASRATSCRTTCMSYDFIGPENGKDSWYATDRNNFAPRVAVAYTPDGGFLSKLTGKGGVIRAGGGLVYDRFGSDLVTKFDSNASFGLSDIVQLGPSVNFTDRPALQRHAADDRAAAPRTRSRSRRPK